MVMINDRNNQSLSEMMKGFSHIIEHQGPARPPHSKLNDFQRTQPPKFAYPQDPLEADDWLRTIEKKLEVARVSETDKVPFATHYLEGSASIWWDNLREVHSGGEPISWTEFKNQFHRTHIPASLMNIK